MFLFHLGFSGADSLVKRNHLVLGGDHADNVLVISELQLSNAFKALLEMRLDTHRILCFRQNLQQFIVGQEEKPAIRSPPPHRNRFTTLFPGPLG